MKAKKSPKENNPPLKPKTLVSIYKELAFGDDVRIIKAKVPSYDKRESSIISDGLWVGVPTGKDRWGVWIYRYDKKGGLTKLKDR
ncbi:MAG: hypothetical protein V1744_00870 [Candidatus Altiarchaeota archaeon]